jgi:hypothetical protein
MTGRHLQHTNNKVMREEHCHQTRKECWRALREKLFNLCQTAELAQ